MTEKLYDTDSHLFAFDCTVVSCEKEGERYAVRTDRTAFFPEEGGQYGDRGTLGDAAVLDTRLISGDIVHLTDRPLCVGETVCGKIDADDRMRKMQNHSGEHIISGLFHRLYGLNNVGFHLGRDDVTVDLDGELSRADLDRVEKLANRAVYENVEILAEYPSPDRLATMDYRSKLDLTENVRIVTIPGYDVCACCAPHVSRTGEIGIIKLLDFARYKGGIRIHMLCGADALRDYREKYRNTAEISTALKVKQYEVAEGVRRILDEKAELSRKLAATELSYARAKAESIPPTDGNVILFDDMDTAAMREFVNQTLPKCRGAVGVFSGDDRAGYRFILGSGRVDLKAKVKDLTAALGGRGGGSCAMIQGSVGADRETILKYFEQFS
ncbi:MAG: alanyl-tRNA editing protein [Eubacteriales bacterium]